MWQQQRLRSQRIEPIVEQLENGAQKSAFQTDDKLNDVRSFAYNTNNTNYRVSASEMTYIVSCGALNSTHSLTHHRVWSQEWVKFSSIR